MYKQGEVVAVKFPFTDGSEFKKRPVLIISNNEVNSTGDFLVVQITSKFYNDDLSVAINDVDCELPMPLKSYIRAHKMFTINETLILSKITIVETALVNEVANKIGNLIKVKTK